MTASKVMILLTNNTVKKAMRRIKTESQLHIFQKKWSCELIKHQGILIFESIEHREKFLTKFGQIR